MIGIVPSMEGFQRGRFPKNSKCQCETQGKRTEKDNNVKTCVIFLDSMHSVTYCDSSDEVCSMYAQIWQYLFIYIPPQKHTFEQKVSSWS